MDEPAADSEKLSILLFVVVEILVGAGANDCLCIASEADEGNAGGKRGTISRRKEQQNATSIHGIPSSSRSLSPTHHTRNFSIITRCVYAVAVRPLHRYGTRHIMFDQPAVDQSAIDQ